VHTSFNQTGAVTGASLRKTRICRIFPFVPSRTRGAPRLVVERGRMIAADYSQVELRIAAHCQRRPARSFTAGQDIHRATAAKVLSIAGSSGVDRRSFAKRVNFGLLYGMGAQSWRSRPASKRGAAIRQLTSRASPTSRSTSTRPKRAKTKATWKLCWAAGAISDRRRRPRCAHQRHAARRRA
jgi:hypothetical protein